MTKLLASLEGKRTHILVVLAILLYLGGIIDTPQGIDLSAIDSKALSNSLLMAAISTVKLGIERVLSK